jgi:hypothetical protein
VKNENLKVETFRAIQRCAIEIRDVLDKHRMELAAAENAQGNPTLFIATDDNEDDNYTGCDDCSPDGRQWYMLDDALIIPQSWRWDVKGFAK